MTWHRLVTDTPPSDEKQKLLLHAIHTCCMCINWKRSSRHCQCIHCLCANKRQQGQHKLGTPPHPCVAPRVQVQLAQAHKRISDLADELHASTELQRVLLDQTSAVRATLATVGLKPACTADVRLLVMLATRDCVLASWYYGCTPFRGPYIYQGWQPLSLPLFYTVLTG